MVGMALLALLACRVTDIALQSGEPPTRTATRPRPTFTLFAQAVIPDEPTNTPAPPPTRTPTLRPAPTRVPTPAKSSTPAPPPPTPDPQGSYYYKYKIVSCVPGDNTRIQGTVTDSGRPVNGISVRVTADPDGPAIVEIMSGVDPTDPKHVDPSLTGKYRLGIAEGARTPGNWWVFIVSTDGNPETAKALIHTDEWANCNLATIDWAH